MASSGDFSPSGEVLLSTGEKASAYTKKWGVPGSFPFLEGVDFSAGAFRIRLPMSSKAQTFHLGINLRTSGFDVTKFTHLSLLDGVVAISTDLPQGF